MAVDLERVIFIIGVGRSGTTLLQCMLNAHSRVAFLPETHFLRRYADKPRLAAKVRRLGMKTLLPRLRRDADVGRAGIDPEYFSDSPDMREWFRRLLRYFASARKADRVGEKDPKNIEHLPLIRQWFPRAQVIHLVRDPRDVMVSRLRAAWSRRQPFLFHLAACRLQLNLGCSLGPKLFAGAYREIRYEDLVTRPHETLQSLCRHLGLDYEPAMLDYTAAAKELISQAEAEWKGNCFRPVMTGNTGNWRGVLSPRRLRRIEWVCAETFTRFAYPRECIDPPPLHRKAAAWFWNSLFHLVEMGYRLRYARQPLREKVRP